MALRLDVKKPSDLHEVWTDTLKTGSTEIELTLRIYAPTEGHFTPDGHRFDETFGTKLLEPLFTAWTSSLRHLSHPPEAMQVRIVLDITRPNIREPNATNFILYESRGLMRITALLRQKFSGAGELKAAVVGAPCWCVLRECEKHVVLPKAESWPVRRASHVQRTEAGSCDGARCLEMAREHWGDAQWLSKDVS